ncbi:hypothetical protein ABPG74_008552 [Tetrahymena malaccensis]
MKNRKGRTKQHAFLYISESPRETVCQYQNCQRQANHFCKLCNKSLCQSCYKMEKVEDVFVISGGEHKICGDCYYEFQMMTKLISQYNLRYNSNSQFNVQLWIKDYKQQNFKLINCLNDEYYLNLKFRNKTQLSQLYCRLKNKEQYPSLEIDIENTHFNSSYHQFLIKTTEGMQFQDIKMAIKNVVNAFLHYDQKIQYKKELLYQAFYLLNFTDEVGAFAMMIFLYDHIIPQQLYRNDPEFIRNLTMRILEFVSKNYKSNLELIPVLKQLLHDKLSLWILSLFSYNFRFIISLHNLQQIFSHYSFESVVNSVIAIVVLIYPKLKSINYNTDQNKLDGILFTDIVFSQYKQKLIHVGSSEDYFKLVLNKQNLNNDVWGNDYQQSLDLYQHQNEILKLEITNLKEECKLYQQKIEEIEKKYIECEFESAVIPLQNDSSQRERIENLKQEQEELTLQLNKKKELIKTLEKADQFIKEQLGKLTQEMEQDLNSIDEKELERTYIEEEERLNKVIEDLENQKKNKKELIDVISSELKQVNLALDLMKQQQQ